MIKRKFQSAMKGFLCLFLAGLLLASLGGGDASAQDDDTVAQNVFGVSGVFLKKITVTARKREELIQDVPLSITHFSSEQLETLKVNDLESLTVRMPNVALDDAISGLSIANFSIRGVGINESIASVDPTVGVFVDGIYMGQISIVLFDTFDVESIEVLRGPQGTLFGRNVTGGAILINTKKPGDVFEISARTSFEGGGESLNSYYMGTIGGPISETVSVKVSAYTNQDNGWFKNLHTGEAFGENDIRMVRPMIVWNPTDDVSLVLRYQYESTRNDGTASQNQRDFDLNSHDFSIDEEGFRRHKHHFFTAQLDWDVDFGDGTVTNIFGFYDAEGTALLDIDSTPENVFSIRGWTPYRQWSNELRYAGRFFESLHATTGLYYFTNEINYHDSRYILGGALTQNLGGDYFVDTLGVFLSLDYDLTDRVTLISGTRYSHEKRKVETVSATAVPCNVAVGPACEFDFTDEETWNSWSPKLGAVYHISGGANIYGHWTRGFRSGGYNLRNSFPPDQELPGPYDEERIDTFEAGFKISTNRGILNGAVFYNMIDDVQRIITLPRSASVFAQEIRNTADVEAFGFELDGLLAVTGNFFLLGSIGYADPEYTKIKYDLNVDGVLDKKDLALELPRAAKLTWSVGATHNAGLANWGKMTSRVSYSYRDKSYLTDNNVGYTPEQNIVEAGIDIAPMNDRFSVGFYGKNLLNEVRHGSYQSLDNPLFPQLGGSFAPLSKGRTFGVQLTYRYR
ncbi:MAG: TonB-dependent receptor plug domain-containing protein [Candidatus Dadabacteria bacterium]|nr:TonB-dependent receptor plug domain-containing protein [Candidatus Dadabacteria bacterium]MYB26987.1 TonB-dependent receptor plug domain-containing protein [Candidatus Dadabacteria bacterium]